MVFSLQDAFEVLVENYEFNDMEGPGLAFRRAASVLKSLPWEVRRMEAAQDLPCLGEHTKAVMEVRPRFHVQFRREQPQKQINSTVFRKAGFPH